MKCLKFQNKIANICVVTFSFIMFFFSFISPFIFTPPISLMQSEEVTEPVVETTTPSTTTSTTSSSSTTTTTTGSSTPITSSPSLSPSATAQASAAVLVNTSRLDSSHFLVDGISGSGNVTGCAGCLCNCTSNQMSLAHHLESSTQRHLPIPTFGWFSLHFLFMFLFLYCLLSWFNVYPSFSIVETWLHF